MKLKWKAILWINKTKTGKKIISSQRYRIILSAAVAFTFNLLYAMYHCILGVLNLSFWFIAMCAFYGILQQFQLRMQISSLTKPCKDIR